MAWLVGPKKQRGFIGTRRALLGGGVSSTLTFSFGPTDLGAGAANTTPTKANGSLTPTFTRATGAETTLSTGLVALVASGTARSNYAPAGTYIGYLAEAARTNTTLHSQDTTGWTCNGGTGSFTGTTATAPDGTSTGITYTEGGGSTTFFFYPTNSGGSAGANHAVSVYLKAGTRRYVNVGAGNGAGNNFWATVDTTAWTITSSGAAGLGTYVSSEAPELINNGWYRIKVVGSITGLVPNLTIAGSDVSNPAALTPNYIGSSTIIWWGAECDVADFTSSYITTTTAAVTRNADVLQYVSSGNLASVAMTMALSWTPEALAMGTVFMFGTYVDASNYTAILHDGTNVIARKRIAGANHDATKALTYAAGTTYRIVARFDNTYGVDVWINGVKGTGDSTTTASQIGTNFQIGADGNGANQAFGSIKNLVVYNSSLADTLAASL